MRAFGAGGYIPYQSYTCIIERIARTDRLDAHRPAPPPGISPRDLAEMLHTTGLQNVLNAAPDALA